jgi:glycosyltransferase involved in cell wall biosynthesis
MQQDWRQSALMKILYCNKYNFRFSGTEAYLFDAMQLMRSRGHETALFSMADGRGEANVYDPHFVPLTDFKAPSGPVAKTRLALHAIYSVEARKRIARVIREFNPDVAHVRNIYHHLSPSILWELKSQGVPVLYHLNDFKLICPSYNLVSSGQACERCHGGKFWNVIREGCYAGGTLAATVLAAEAYFHRWISTYQKCVDLILTPSHFAKQKLLENGWPEERIQVLPHFQNAPLRTNRHPGAGAPILYFGRLSAEKGVDDLILAVQLLPHIQFLIAGDGPQRGWLEKLAQNLGLTNVHFIGHVNGTALEELISGSQFTVFPSRAYETMGKSILESYAQGRAVVASDLGSRRELIEEGKTGLLYEVRNAEQLSSKIAFLHEHPELADQMGRAGLELVRARHSQEKHLRVLENIYRDLGGNRKPERRKALFPSFTKRNNEQQSLRVALVGGRGVIGKYSGIETYYEEAGARLVEMGHQVTIYCRSYFTPKIAEYRGMRLVRLPTLRTKHLETLIHTLLSTIHACFSGCDIVHYHTLGPSMFALLPRLFGKKTIVTVQGLDWKRKKWGRAARWALKLCEWTSARLPNCTVVVSRTLQEYYRGRYAKECAYVPNGTEIRRRRRIQKLKTLGLETDEYVLFLGRFSPEKNCDLLVDAFEKLGTPTKLVLAGGSSHTDEYAANLERRQNERIKILDWVSGEALEELLTNAAVFVLPSDMEGLSLALLDAMGAGVCVLASDVPENMEAICDAGFTFKSGDIQDLRRMLRLLLANPDLRAGAGRRAQEVVRQRYLWDRVATEISGVYRSLDGHSHRIRATRKVASKAA